MTCYADSVPAHPHGVMLHHLHDDATHLSRQGSVDAETFDRLIDFVSASAELLPAHEWQRRAETHSLGPRDVCLTFDDGLRCQLDLAIPALERRGLTAFFFVYSASLDGELDRLELYAHFRHAHFDSMDAFYRAFDENLEAGPNRRNVEQALAGFDPRTYLEDAPFYSDSDRRFRFLRDRVLGPDAYHETMDDLIGEHIRDRAALSQRLLMRPADVRGLHAAGHVVGLHSHSHPTDLCALSPADQRNEYETCQRKLGELLQYEPTCVAHPCGRYDATTLGILRDLGIVVGFRADFAYPDASGLEYPRQDHANIVRAMPS